MMDQSEKKVGPSGLTTKSVIDDHKGWFDYASCCLGVSAWDAAVFGVAYNTWTDHRILGPEIYFIYIPAVVVAAVYGVFLHTRLFRMGWALMPIMRDMIGAEGWKLRVAAPLIVFWLRIGHQVFTITLTFHLLYALAGFYKQVH